MLFDTISEEVVETAHDNRTDNDSHSACSRPSLKMERKRLDQHSRGARLNFRKGSPLGLTIEELDDRGLIDGGDTVPSYEASFKQRSRRPLEMRKRSSRLKGRGNEKLSPKVLSSFFHMVQVLIKRGLNFDELLRQYDEHGTGIVDKDQFVKACRALGLPFSARSLVQIHGRYSVSSSHMDYETLLHDVYSGVNNSALRAVSDDSLENGDTIFYGENGSINTILIELKRMLKQSALALQKSFDDIYRMFSRWDVGGTGTVTATQFLRVLAHLRIVFSEQHQDFLVELFDTSGEGRVDFDSLLTFCFLQDSDYGSDVQSPYLNKTYSYFGDDNTTSNSALSVGSGDNGDTSVEKLDVNSPDGRAYKSAAIEELSIDIAAVMTGNTKPSTAASPDRNIIASSNASFQNGRPRPRTAIGGNRDKPPHQTDASSLSNGGHYTTEYDPNSSPRHRGTNNGGDANSSGSHNNSGNNKDGVIESPSSRARHLVRPMTAAPRVPLTVSVPRQPKGNGQTPRDGNLSGDDEFVVDVLSDDDVIDGDLDDPIDLRFSGAPKEFESAVVALPENPTYANRAEVLYVDDYNSRMKEERDIRQFTMAAAEVLGPDVLVNRTVNGTGNRSDAIDRSVETHKSSAVPRPSSSQQDPKDVDFHTNNAQQTIQLPQQQVYIRPPLPMAHSSYKEANQHDPSYNGQMHSQHRALEQPSDHHLQDPVTFGLAPAVLLKMLRRHIIHGHQNSGKTLYDIFRTFDVLGNRYFGPFELQRTMLELNIPIESYQATEMIHLLALDGEDRVSFAEFAVFITDPDFPSLADHVQRMISDQYEKQGREYQLKLFNIMMQISTGATFGGSSGSSGNNHASPVNAQSSAITGFIPKTAFEKALGDLGLVASGNSKSDSRGSYSLLTPIEVSRLCVRFDTHGRDQCSVAKFLRMVQTCSHWRAAEHNVTLMEEAAEEAQTAREELAQYPNGLFIGPPPGYYLNEELIDMAEYLGIRVLSEPYMLRIVDAAVRAPVPEGWSIHTDKKGRNFFFHQKSGRSQWDHPADDEFRKLRDEARSIYHNQRTQQQQEKSSNIERNAIHNGPIDQVRKSRPISARDHRSESPSGGIRTNVRAQGPIPDLNQHRKGAAHTAPYSQSNTLRRNEITPSNYHPEQPHAEGGQYPDESWQQQHNPTAIGDAVLQAMNNIDPAVLLKILNKNGDLLTAIGITKTDQVDETGIPVLNNSPNVDNFQRHVSAPALRKPPSTSIPLIPVTASTKRNSSPNRKKLANSSSAAPSRKNVHHSYRHNGSGALDRQRGDRERMQQKRTHNWTAPSAVERALNVGKGVFGASSTHHVLSNGEEEARQKELSPTHQHFYGETAKSAPVFRKIVHDEQEDIPYNSSDVTIIRPKSGSSVRKRLPGAGDSEGDKVSGQERPKTAVRQDVKDNDAPRFGATNLKVARSHPHPIDDPIYGEKLLSRLDALVSRGGNNL